MSFHKFMGYKALIGFGLLSVCFGILIYGRHGFSAHLWLYWAVGCLALLAGSFRKDVAASHTKQGQKLFGSWQKRDWLIAGAILVLCSAVYLYNVYDFPLQVPGDEIAVMGTERVVASEQTVDIFGIDSYARMPAFIFWLLGKLGLALGSVTLGHMRLLSAISGVCTVVLCYMLLRLLRLPRSAAVAGTVTVAVCHSLLLISRTGVRDNTALLFEIMTLTALWYGWQQRSYGWTFIGGLLGGLTFYTYFPSRITLVIWLVFVAAFLVSRKLHDWQPALKRVGVAIVGSLIIATPLAIASMRSSDLNPYLGSQFLFTKSGQMQEWANRGTAMPGAAYRINAIHGLLTFNKPYSDQGGMMVHFGYGFVDSITGVLLWLGFAVIIAQAIRRKRLPVEDLFCLAGFLVIWLSLAFLLTKAPDYTRLLLVLPFVGYLIGRFVDAAGVYGGRLLKQEKLRRRSGWAVATAVMIVVAVFNAHILLDYQRLARTDGDALGETLRFQEAHSREAAQWVYAPRLNGGYYTAGSAPDWAYWINFGKGETQSAQVVSIQQLANNDMPVFGTGVRSYLLTTSDTWRYVRSSFQAHWKVVQVQNLDHAGERQVITYQSR